MHNLKSIDVDIPLGKLVVICGVSGSGKTSLALDTLYAEGQRRYIESFSPYTRQFLQRLDKPEYDSLDNMPASIAVKRGALPRSNRSTVGTTAEIDDYLRILIARIGKLFCPSCGQQIERHTPSSIIQWVAEQAAKRAMIGFEFSWVDANDLASQLASLQQSGFTRIILGDRQFNLSDENRSEMALAAKKTRSGFVIVDRIVLGEKSPRLSESIETAYEWGHDTLCILAESSSSSIESTAATPVKPTTKKRGSNLKAATKTHFNSGLGSDTGTTTKSESNHELPRVAVDDRNFEIHRFSRELVCFACNRTFANPEPRSFSFNSSLGACPTCEGLGEVSELDFDKIVPDKSKSIREGAIAPWTTPAYEHELQELLALAKEYKIPVDVPYTELDDSVIQLIINGVPERNFGGMNGFFQWLDKKKYKMHIRIFAARWRSYRTCETCRGRRLNEEALAYRIHGVSMDQLSSMKIDDAADWIGSLLLQGNESKIAADSISQLKNRLGFLQQVGLGYLTLERPLRTLSGGEATRVTLTTSLGSDLVSMLYVLDEPTVGLHPADTQQLINAISSLRERGNTVLVIEHEPSMILRADHLIEIGPRAGREGGTVSFAGSLNELFKSRSLTGKYLQQIASNDAEFEENSSKRKSATTSKIDDRPLYSRRTIDWDRAIHLKGGSGRNLQSVDVQFPLNCLCLVTGVSGSGKSSLVLDTLAAALDPKKKTSKAKKGSLSLPYLSITGDDAIDECIVVDQEPIGMSPRSNPATYTRVFDEIRNIFADTHDARVRGFTKDEFSFNNAKGQCPRCEGDGVLAIDMQFLADIQTPCPECHGSRFRHAVLEVKYRDRSIAECLNMSIEEARDFFRGFTKLQTKLQSLIDVGLGYLQLGQAAPTLSSGEAQRLKLASYLNDNVQGKTLFIMDEPTAGLHFFDVERLIGCLNRLVDSNHSVIVIEHNEQMIRAADYVIDLGPGAAEKGGRIIATGTPEEIAANKQSVTGKFLRALNG